MNQKGLQALEYIPTIQAYINKLGMPSNILVRVEAHGCIEIRFGEKVLYDKRALTLLTKAIPPIQCEEYERIKEVGEAYGIHYRK